MKANIAVYQILAADGNVTGAVNGIYPMLAKEGTDSPYISIIQDEVDPRHTKDGGASIEYTRVIIQINSTDQRASKDIADDVRAALDGYAGTITTADESIIITRIIFDTMDHYVEHEPNRTMYIQEMDFIVRERRTPDF